MIFLADKISILIGTVMLIGIGIYTVIKLFKGEQEELQR